MGQNHPILHTPVLVNEVVRELDIQPNDVVLDATLGWGGHAKALLANHPKHYIGLDRDPEAISHCRHTLPNIQVIESRFSEWALHITDPPNKVLADLGMSSIQLDSPHRGFSYLNEAPLDMRMGQTDESASDWINSQSFEVLSNAFYEYGQLIHNRRLVENILCRRRSHPIQTTTELVQLIKQSYRFTSRQHMMKVFSQVFQSIRMAINNEMGELNIFLNSISQAMPVNGKIAIITFHSGEDRVVKRFFKSSPLLQPIKPDCIKPTQVEIQSNRRAKSALLRVATRVNEL